MTEDQTPIDGGAETVLVARPHLDLVMHKIGLGAAEFLKALQVRETLEVAAATGSAADPQFDLSDNLIAMFSAEILVDVAPPEPQSSANTM